jgi:hypothetical protein
LNDEPSVFFDKHGFFLDRFKKNDIILLLDLELSAWASSNPIPNFLWNDHSSEFIDGNIWAPLLTAN